MNAFVNTNDKIELFNDIELTGWRWNCSLQGLSEDSTTLTVVLKRELIVPEDTPEHKPMECAYTFDNINKDKEGLTDRFERVIGKFKEIGGKILADTLKKSICKAKEARKCRAKD